LKCNQAPCDALTCTRRQCRHQNGGKIWTKLNGKSSAPTLQWRKRAWRRMATGPSGENPKRGRTYVEPLLPRPPIGRREQRKEGFGRRVGSAGRGITGKAAEATRRPVRAISHERVATVLRAAGSRLEPMPQEPSHQECLALRHPTMVRQGRVLGGRGHQSFWHNCDADSRAVRCELVRG
jgi:hypothetical protein